MYKYGRSAREFPSLKDHLWRENGGTEGNYSLRTAGLKETTVLEQPD
jgi:hypothetical protein